MEVFLTDAWTGPVNCMLDLETWGTASGSALRSIGAVMFDPHSEEMGATFYANILDESCRQAGLVKDERTVVWWADPKKAKANEMLSGDQLTLTEVAVAFEEWWRKNRAIFVWSQGANFDEPLWSAAMRAIGRSVPWKFYDARDTRTAYDVCGFDSRSVRRAGTYHNALDDARHQAVCVQRSYAKIEGRTK